MIWHKAKRGLWCAAVLSVAAIACGGATVSSSTDGGPASSPAEPNAGPSGNPPTGNVPTGGQPAPGGSPTTADASAPSPGIPDPPCPFLIPADSTPCSVRDLSCEYGGTGPNLLCSTRAMCVSTAGGAMAWNVTKPAPDCIASPAQNPKGCPPSFTALPAGAACPNLPVSDESTPKCVYPEGVCGCESCTLDGGMNSTQWMCAPWLTPERCPVPRPRVGTRCTTEGLSCWYETSCTVDNQQPVIACTNGLWTYEAHGVDCAMPACKQ